MENCNNSEVTHTSELVKKYSDISISGIIALSKRKPGLYLECLRLGMFSHQLNKYFVDLYKCFKYCELGNGFNIGDVYNLLSVDPNFNADITYAPWARAPFIEGLNDYWKGPQALDIQLGGACNYNCRYCDSYECRAQINAVDLKIVKELIEGYPIKQIYICGVGEPTVGTNILKLKEILQMAEAHNIKVSMYTNFSNMDELFEYLSNGTLSILYKHDTNDIAKMQRLYGCSLRDAQKMLENRRIVENIVCYDSKNRTTNIAASIVPTQENIGEIPDIIKDCIANHIYPMVGGLEKSGKATEGWNELASDNKNALLKIKQTLREYGIYQIATCPAVAGSLHISNTNFVVGADFTGSSCPWDTLETPRYEAFTFLPEGTNDLWSNLNFVREQKLRNNINPWLEDLALLGVAPNIINEIKEKPTEIICYFGPLCYAQCTQEEDLAVFYGCGGKSKNNKEIIALGTLDYMARKKVNCLRFHY